ncbi:MAG: FAD:protein FMN transferase [Armatimonadota bacterium]|nr:FAD:protein FMN transferase [Armatimonadota bacterium]
MIPTSPVKLSIPAMGTRFELVLYGDNPLRLRSAAEEAITEIERLDQQLSFYRPDSDLSWINTHGAKGPVKVEPRMFRLLEQALEISHRTAYSFDITIAPLMRAWGFVGGKGRIPDSSDIEAARSATGIDHIHLDPKQFTITFDHPGVELDLGAIGKGYAIERAVEILRENGIQSALLHGGTSSISAIGTQPDGRKWKIAVNHPIIKNKPFDIFEIENSSLSVSAAHGKAFTDGTVEYCHVIDPRSGQPTREALIAAVAGPSSTICDALATALLVLGTPGLELLAAEFPDYSAKVLDNELKVFE